MQSRAKEYRINAAVCAMHAAAVPDPMKQFYQALELQWECLARQAEREGVNGNEVEPARPPDQQLNDKALRIERCKDSCYADTAEPERAHVAEPHRLAFFRSRPFLKSPLRPRRFRR